MQLPGAAEKETSLFYATSTLNSRHSTRSSIHFDKRTAPEKINRVKQQRPCRSRDLACLLVSTGLRFGPRNDLAAREMLLFTPSCSQAEEEENRTLIGIRLRGEIPVDHALSACLTGRASDPTHNLKILLITENACPGQRKGLTGNLSRIHCSSRQTPCAAPGCLLGPRHGYRHYYPTARARPQNYKATSSALDETHFCVPLLPSYSIR